MSAISEDARLHEADAEAFGLAADRRPHSSSLGSLLAELPSRVRAVIDTGVFARLGGTERQTLERLAEATGSHVVAYDLRITGKELPLCAAVGQADLDRDQIAALRAAERKLPPWIALVGYARPAEMRLPEEVLVRAAATRRTGEAAPSHSASVVMRPARCPR
jgi:hypothetical protein